MKVLVMNYTDWVGYHLVDTLLNEGYQVYGVEKKAGNPHLKDFFIRNSNFHSLEKIERTFFPLVICIGEMEEQEQEGINTDRLFLINAKTFSKLENVISIRIPFLFGEFMPMDEQGVYHHGVRIEFSSDILEKSGIYIADFVKIILQWLQTPPEVKEISLERAENMDNQTLTLEKKIVVHENVPIGIVLENVRQHYRRYKELYPLIKE